ncbi:MAG: hypothetical protein AAFV45_13610 [Pseudomonadota bacterium]
MAPKRPKHNQIKSALRAVWKIIASGAAIAALGAGASSAAATEYCVTCSDPQATYICQTDLGGSKFQQAGAKLLCISHLAKRFGHRQCAASRGERQSRCLGKIIFVTAKQALEETSPPIDQADGLPEVVPVAPTDEARPRRTPQSPAVGPPATRPATSPPANAATPRPADNFPDGLAATNQGDDRTTPPQPSPGKVARPDDSDQPPKTVEELAKRATESSKESLEKAGKAVGNVAKGAGDAVTGAAKKTWECLTSLLTDCLN